jgi:hypothetical protein
VKIDTADGVIAAADGYGIWAVAALTALSGVIVAVRMYETVPRARSGTTSPWEQVTNASPPKRVSRR